MTLCQFSLQVHPVSRTERSASLEQQRNNKNKGAGGKLWAMTLSNTETFDKLPALTVFILEAEIHRTKNSLS